MDLKAYYRKIHDVEGMIPDTYVVIVSLETPDGGRPGVMTEVPKRTAAKMIVGGRARLASDEETAQYREEGLKASEAARQAAEAQKIRIAVVSESELKSRRSGPKADR